MGVHQDEERIGVPDEAQPIIEALLRRGFAIDSISAERLCSAERANLRYVAVAVPTIDAVYRLLQAFAELDLHSQRLCHSILMVGDDGCPDGKFAVLVGIKATVGSLH